MRSPDASLRSRRDLRTLFLLSLWAYVASQPASGLAMAEVPASVDVFSEDLKNLTLIPNGAHATLTLSANSTLPLIAANGSSFAVLTFEVHSQFAPVILSVSAEPPSAEIGDDPEVSVDNHAGLVLNGSLIQTVYVTNPHAWNVGAVILVRSGGADMPIPGLCNGTGGPHLASSRGGGVINKKPEVRISWGPHIVQINFTSAGLLRLPGFGCNDSTAADDFEYTVYHRFLEERNFDEAYFLGELSTTMLEETSVQTHGDLISYDFIQSSANGTAMTLYYSAYPGAASIFAVLVKYRDNQTALYVSSATYACVFDEDHWLNCRVMWYTATKVICAISVFVGLFLAFRGHHHFHWSQITFAFTACSFVGYILASKYLDLSYLPTLGIGGAIGVAGVGVWFLIWCLFGIPILAVCLPSLMMGFLVASLVFFLPAMNVATFTADINYWLALGGISLVVPVILISFTKTASLLSCVVLGAFAVVIPMDHYLGSSLKYIVINVMRRATVEHFDVAVLAPPFQTSDITLLVTWAALMLVGLIFQQITEQGRAPFPPNPYQIWRFRRDEASASAQNRSNSERTPLITPYGRVYYDESGVYDSVTLNSTRRVLEENAETQRSNVERLRRAFAERQGAAAGDLVSSSDTDFESAVEAVTGPFPRRLPEDALAPSAPLAEQHAVATAASTSSVSSGRHTVPADGPPQRRSRDIFKPSTPEAETV